MKSEKLPNLKISSSDPCQRALLQGSFSFGDSFTTFYKYFKGFSSSELNLVVSAFSRNRLFPKLWLCFSVQQVKAQKVSNGDNGSKTGLTYQLSAGWRIVDGQGES